MLNIKYDLFTKDNHPSGDPTPSIEDVNII